MRPLPSDAISLPAIIKIEKASAVIAFTTHSEAITVEGVTYATAPAAAITGMQCPSDGTPANADITVAAEAGGLFTPGDGARGILDDWPITVALVDPNNTSGGSFVIIKGTVGSVAEDNNNVLTIAANGHLRKFLERPLCEHYQLICANDLGDDRCKIPILVNKEIDFFDIGRSQDFVRPDVGTPGLQAVKDAYGRKRSGSPDVVTVESYNNLYYQNITPGTTDSADVAYPASAGSTITDGTAQFIAVNSWTRYARGHAIDPYHIQFTTLPDPRASDATWFINGGLYIRSGNLSGFPGNVIMEWDPSTLTARIGVAVAVADVPANTQFEVHPGCDLTRTQCAGRFTNSANPSGTNIENHFAFEFVPPPDFGFGF